MHYFISQVELRINNVALKTKFHVMPQVSHQLILGMDFFKRHNVVLDFQEGNVIIKGPKIYHCNYPQQNGKADGSQR